MTHGFLYLCVSVGGASVLAVEILGTRILGPFYGVSLFLWSALITVTLTALSIGYSLGGRWADRGATIQRLCSLLVGAGVWMLLVPWFRQPILWVAEPFGIRFAVLIAALLLFFPPLMLLGMISPYAIKLKTQSLGDVGRTAGNLYAVSTLASVAAALLTGFFLIPHFGVTRLTLAIGILLLVTGSFGFMRRFRTNAKYTLPLIILICGAVGTIPEPGKTTDSERGLISIKQSPYAEIRVVDEYGTRYLLIDGGVHTVVDPSNWETLYPYVNAMDIAKLFFEKPGDLLLIGLGGGSVVKHYAQEGWSIDVVEIDPAVTETAYDYFGLEPAEAQIYHMDGREFLNRAGTYDIIILDAFGSSAIPFHLVTKEMFANIGSHLNPDGLLAINVEAIGWHGLIVRSLAATLETYFSNVLALPLAEPPNELGNVILFASDKSLELTEEPPSPEWRISAEYDRAHAWDNRFKPDIDGAPILTDDLNPVDLWAEEINMLARIKLHEYFGREGVSW
jgi:spermidine synthase